MRGNTSTVEVEVCVPPMTPTRLVDEIRDVIMEWNGRDAADDITPTDVAERIVAVVSAHDGPVLA